MPGKNSLHFCVVHRLQFRFLQVATYLSPFEQRGTAKYHLLRVSEFVQRTLVQGWQGKQPRAPA